MLARPHRQEDLELVARRNLVVRHCLEKIGEPLRLVHRVQYQCERGQEDEEEVDSLYEEWLVRGGEQVHAEPASHDIEYQSQHGDDRQAHHRFGLSSDLVAVEVLGHVQDLVAYLVVQHVGSEVTRPQPVQIACQCLVGNLVEPIAVREAQEDFLDVADAALERPYRFDVADVHLRHRDHESIAQHQQRRLLKMRNQAEQEVLVPELAQHPTLLIDAELVVGVDDHRERVAAAHEARIRPVVGAARLLPVPVVAVAGLEIAQEAFRVRQRPRFTRPGHQSQPHEVTARQLRLVAEREIAHHRHPLVFDFAVAQGPGLVGLVRNQRAQQVGPVGCDAGGAVLSDMSEIARAVLVVGGREYPTGTG